jgi:alkyl hydroperoxide reductase/ thiol specific antioxidant/ mal allergen
MTLQNSFLRIVFLSLLFALGSVANAQYKIDLQVNGLRDSSIIFGYYFGEGRYVQDTAKLDARGHATLKRDSSLAKGLYLFLLPTGESLDLLIGDQQKFTFSVDMADLRNTQKVEGASLSQAFLDFQTFMGQMQQRGESVRKEDSLVRNLPASDPNTEKKREEIREKYKALDTEVKAFHKELLAQHGEDVLGEFVRATIPISLPEYHPDPSVKNVDSARWMWSYTYNSEHYLDNINLASSSLLRTPLVLPKVNHFLDKMILQIPDTLNKYCDKILERAYLNTETFRFWTSYLLNKYQSSEIIGMDAVFVHIADKYYLAGRTPWVDEEFLFKLKDRVAHIKPNLLWAVAPNFKVETLNAQSFELAKDKADATVLVFWEPSCSHCKVAIPKIDSIARKYDPKRLHVIGFMTTGDGPEWQKYVFEHKLEWWINVWDPYRKTGFHDNYDIYSTPVIYVLDKNHKIVIKRIGVESLAAILDDLLKK